MEKINKGKATHTPEECLRTYFTRNPKVALAFSGGTDSTLLLFAAKEAGCAVRPYFMKTPFQPQSELEQAQELCRQAGVELTLLREEVLLDPEVVRNGPDRCYFCKKRIFGRILEAAAKDGLDFVLDGTNASDDASDRPGMRALAEYKVHSPLKECGITKEEVRELSRARGLKTANQPSNSCLATRIPTGQALTRDMLARVERAEEAVAALGFLGFRVRVRGENRCLLQITETDFDKVAKRRVQLLDVLKNEFGTVHLDLTARVAK